MLCFFYVWVSTWPSLPRNLVLSVSFLTASLSFQLFCPYFPIFLFQTFIYLDYCHLEKYLFRFYRKKLKKAIYINYLNFYIVWMICDDNRILDILTIVESELEQLDFSSIRTQCMGLLLLPVPVLCLSWWVRLGADPTYTWSRSRSRAMSWRCKICG